MRGEQRAGVIGTPTPSHVRYSGHQEDELTSALLASTGGNMKGNFNFNCNLSANANSRGAAWPLVLVSSSPSYLCDKILQIIGLTDQSDRQANVELASL